MRKKQGIVLFGDCTFKPGRCQQTRQYRTRSLRESDEHVESQPRNQMSLINRKFQYVATLLSKISPSGKRWLKYSAALKLGLAKGSLSRAEGLVLASPMAPYKSIPFSFYLKINKHTPSTMRLNMGWSANDGQNFVAKVKVTGEFCTHTARWLGGKRLCCHELSDSAYLHIVSNQFHKLSVRN